MQLVKLKNMKARMYKQRTGGGAHLGRGLQLNVYGVWGIFSENLRKKNKTKQPTRSAAVSTAAMKTYK